MPCMLVYFVNECDFDILPLACISFCLYNIETFFETFIFTEEVKRLEIKFIIQAMLH